MTPPANRPGGSEEVLEGDDARRRLDEEQRGSTSRRELAGSPGFEEISPSVGVLDEGAFGKALGDNPDEALTLLADLTGATDERVAEQARRLSGRVLLDVARAGPPRSTGVARLRRLPADRAQGDLDLDRGLEAIGMARATGQPASLDELRVTTWGRPSTALCLVVDRSGSMGGERLAAAALAAAACSWRAGDDYSVLAFARDVVVVKSQDQHRPAELVAGDVLALRGHGSTDLGLALRAAKAQLDRSPARRRIVVLLSDCRPTAGDDPARAAGALPELAIVAPADDHDDAQALARATGARWTPLDGPAGIPAAFARLLGP